MSPNSPPRGKARPLAGLLLLATLQAGNLLAAPPTLELAPCGRDIGVAGAECGTLGVYEDRTAAQGRRIWLRVAVLPALGRQVQPDPLFLLAGGPGIAATALADLAQREMRRIRQSRQIVLVDQRGTGASNGLDCEGVDADSTYYSLGEDALRQQMQDCLAALDADVRQYTTPVAMDDLDEVRAALGYERINLWGGSYGARAALVYLRRHPERVRAVILDGVAPPAIRLPRYLGEDAARALELVLADCQADADCAEAFPDLRGRYRELLDRLAAQPDTLRAPHPRTGEPFELDVTRSTVVLLLRSALYSAESARLIPLVIARAHTGDYGPLLALSDPIAEVGAMVSAGMMFSVLCAEDVAAIAAADRALMAAELFLGTAVLDSWARVCDVWPAGELPADYRDPVVADAPVLILSGELDPVTPPRWGAAVAEHLRHGLHVVVPGAAHGTLGTGCVPRLMAQFLDAGSVDGLDAGCVDELERPRFFLTATGPRVGAAP